MPKWDYERLASTMAIMTVLVGAAVAALDLRARHGAQGVAWLLILSVVVAGGSEFIGTSTGLLFGKYEYTGKLGPQLLGTVPYIIPVAWFMMASPSVAIAEVLGRSRWVTALLAACMVVTWDVALDPAMTAADPAWIWHEDSAFYGVPMSNYATWFGVALVVAGLYLCRAGRHPQQSTKAPWALYTIQSAFPAALAAVYGRVWATLAWAVCFTVLVAAWVVLRRRSGTISPCTGAGLPAVQR